jgi:hypothetical protein
LATAGDRIWVAEGTYYPDEDEGQYQADNDRTSTFELDKDVWLYGGFENGDGFTDRDYIAHPTILSGDLQQDDDAPPDITDTDRQNNAYHVVTGSQESDPVADGARVDGFIITGGYADGGGVEDHGGGVLYGGDRFVRCVFRWNFAEVGGGAIITGDPTVIYNCRFYKNYSGDDDNEGLGGAIHIAHDTADYESYIVNSVFYANEAKDLGGAIYVGTSLSSVVEISNCTIGHSDDDYGNYAKNGGGGVYAGWGGGGTVVVARISNSVIQWNDSPTAWDDLLCEPGIPGDYCGMLIASLYEDGPGGVFEGGGFYEASTTIRDPDGCDDTFVTEDDNFMLDPDQQYGPDDGSGAWIQKDRGDLDDNGHTTDEDIPIDLQGWDRVDLGGTVDMGAVETPWAYKCLGDVDESEEVDIDDLFEILYYWGSCPAGLPADCVCDLNHDCVVDIDDLFEVLGNWGPCNSTNPGTDECVEDCLETYTDPQDILDCLAECD